MTTTHPGSAPTPLRSWAARLLSLALLLASAVVGVVGLASAPAAADRPFTVRFTESIEGGTIRQAGNGWVTCSTTSGVAANTCAAAKSYQAPNTNNDNTRTMVPNDVDGDPSTAYSSSSTLAIPAGAVVRWAGLYWENQRAGDADTVNGPVRLDTPGTAGLVYETIPRQVADAPTNGSALTTSFADVTAQVRAGGAGSYTVAPESFVPQFSSGWSLAVVYGIPGGTNRQVTINDGLAQRTTGSIDIPFGGFRTPPSGNVNADVATVIWDADAGVPDRVSLGNGTTQTPLPNPGPLPNDYANSSVRNLNVKPAGSPNDANNFSVDAKVVATSNVIRNNATSAVIRLEPVSGGDFLYPAMIGIAIDNYSASASLDKEYVDENGGAVEPGDFLRYDVSVQSTGSEAVTLSTLTDALPDGVDYVPGSIVLGDDNYSPGPATDAAGDDVAEYDAASRTVRLRLGDGADPVTGGTLPARPDSPVQTASFRVQVPLDADSTTVSNVATLTGTGAQTGSAISIPTPASSFTVDLQSSLSLDKTATLDDADGDGAADPGESIAYGFTVTNDGNSRLTGVAVDDPTLGDVACTPTTLDPGDEATCTADTRQVTQDDLDSGDPLTNTATATGTDADGDDVTATDGTSTDVGPGAPALELTKVADFTAPDHDLDGDGEIDLGENIGYSFLVTNTGDVTATDVAIDDALAGDVTCDPTTLAPGGSVTCTADTDYVVTQTDVNRGSVTNTATATATNPRGGEVTSPDSSTTTPADPSPSIDLEKTATVTPAERQDGVEAGDTIAYTFTATNAGNVTLSDVGVSDTGLPGLGAVSCTPTVLDPGDVAECTTAADFTVTQDQVDAQDPIDNTATATGTPPAGDAVSDDDTASVPVAAPSPALSITGTPTLADTDGDGLADLDETVSYVFTVTNDGNTTVDGLTLTDDQGLPYTCVPPTIAPGEDAVCTSTGSHTVTQDEVDAGLVPNTGTASGTTPGGTGPGGTVSSGPADADVDADVDPELSLVKTEELVDADGDGVGDVGEEITYGFEVTNTGTVTVDDLAVVDDSLGADAITCVDTRLAPDGVTTCTTTSTHTLTQADIDAGAEYTNTATATGRDPAGDPVQDADTASTPLAGAEPGVSLVKRADFDDADGDGALDEGETIDYSFTVTNSGNVTLSSVTVDDPLLAGVALTCDPPGELAVGAATICTPATPYTVTADDAAAGQIVNTATATGTGVRGGDSDPATDTVTVPSAAIELDKTAGEVTDVDGDGRDSVGDTITYSFLVSNTGTEDLDPVSVSDPQVGAVTCDPAQLAPGEEVTCTADPYVLTQADVDAGEVLNTATASGTPPGGEPVSDEDSVTVELDRAASLGLEKTATLDDTDGDGVADVGETITYAFTVTNTGTTTVSGVTVDDPMLGAVTCAPTTLAAGEQAECTPGAAYEVTEDDVYAGSVDNTATATGDGPAGDPVPEATDSTTTPTATPDPALTIAKFASWDDADDDGALDVGESIGYTFRVTNTGDVTLDPVAVDDDLAGAVTCQETVLAPGADTRCSADADYVVDQDDVDAGTVVNTATASGTPPQGGPVDSDPDSTTTPGVADPAITLTKTATLDDANGNGRADADEEITYAFRLLNSGNQTLDEVAVSDPALGDVTCDATRLPPNAVAECTADDVRVVTQADVDAGDPLVNTATVEGTSPDGTVVDDDDTATVPVAAAAPALELLKQADLDDADGDGELDAGETIAYSFLVTNAGNTTIDGLTVSDPLLGGAGAVTCDETILAPGGSTTCTAADHTVTQDDADAGEVVNTATADGTPARGELDPAEDTVTVPVDSAASVALVKTASLDDANDNGGADAGETISYSFTVTNTGTTTLRQVRVDDPDLGAVTCRPNDGPVAPGATRDCTADAVRTVTVAEADAGDPLVNTATVRATDPAGQVVFDTDTARVAVADAAPALDLVKTGVHDDTDSDGALDVGEEIDYTFRVTNTGNVSITDVAIGDSLIDDAVTCQDTSLEPGQATTCTSDAPYVVTQADVDAGEVVNTATVTGLSARDGSQVEPAEDTAVAPGPSEPGVAIDKRAVLDDRNGDDKGNLGEEIDYTFTVTNTGDVTLTGVGVDDPLLDGLGPITCGATELAPGESTTCTAPEPYVVTAADVEAGQVLNTATVSADGGGEDLDGEDTVRTPTGPRGTDSIDPADPGDPTGPGTPDTPGAPGTPPTSPGGFLPDTGGPAWWAAVLGALALLGGTGLLIGRRRRAG